MNSAILFRLSRRTFYRNNGFVIRRLCINRLDQYKEFSAQIHKMKMITVFYNCCQNHYSMKAIPPSKENVKERKTLDEEYDEGKHIHLTSQNFRDPKISEAVITDVYQLSPTVKGFTVKVSNSKLNFKAGQWIDAFIPNLETVGGFSICSSPSLLKEKGEIILGIKKSLWPPAHWFYTECVPGSRIRVRVGGDFFYPLHDEDKGDLLLIAGGVGVNPIFSIFSHFSHLKSIQRRGDDSAASTGRVSFLFSAKSPQELLYKEAIDSIVRQFPSNFHIKYFTTKDFCSTSEFSSRRISFEDITEGLERLEKTTLKVYICGPPSMIQSMEKLVLKCSIPKSRIYFEKWW